MGGSQYYMLDVLLIVWIYQIFLGTVSSSRQSSIVMKNIQKLSYISQDFKDSGFAALSLMCWDGTRGDSLCFGVAIFSRISQAFSEESSSWELPTVLSLADSYFRNSSFLWGNRKRGSRWRYSELPATVKMPGFQWATPFAKWHRDVIGRKITEQPIFLRRGRKPTEAAPARCGLSRPAHACPALTHLPSPLPSPPSLPAAQPAGWLTHRHSPGQAFHTAPTHVPWLDSHVASFGFVVEISVWYLRESVSPTNDSKDLGVTDVF